ADGDQVLRVGREAHGLEHELLAGRRPGGAAQDRAAQNGQLGGRDQRPRGGGGDDDRRRLLGVQGDGEPVRVAGYADAGGRGRVVDQGPGRGQGDQWRGVRGGADVQTVAAREGRPRVPEGVGNGPGRDGRGQDPVGREPGDREPGGRVARQDRHGGDR